MHITDSQPLMNTASSLFDQVQFAFEHCLASSCLLPPCHESDYRSQLQAMRKQLSEALALLVRLEELEEDEEESADL
jgi:hypothetical protein